MAKKHKCPVCKKFKDSTKPRFAGKDYVTNSRFNNPILTVKTLIICDDCAKKFGITVQ